MMKKFSTILIFSLFFVMFASAQIATDKAALKSFGEKHAIEAERATKRAEQYAKEHNIELRVEHEDGTIIELVDVQNGKPVFNKTFNSGAATTTRATALYPGGSLGLNITGEGYDKIGVWDGGRARLTHQEFNNTGTPRVTAGDDYTTLSNHSTHVAGTILAGGVQANAKGMAYLAELKSYYWDAALAEMSQAAADGMEISNHSWGQVAGWNYNNGWTWLGDENIHPTIDYKFGHYSTISRNWDNLGRLAPYFLMVVAAGNDRGEGPYYAGTGNNPEKDGGTTGYDCIEGSGLSKNVLTVGAVRQVNNYTGPSSVSMSSFSSWGPTDDGRIKPDIVGKGVNVYSCSTNSDASYTTMDGTSMATPNVTGTLVLLNQLYQQKHGDRMLSSTLKGLAIHTADECGPNEGPDYMYGWGLLNAERAAELILQNEAKGTMREVTITNGGSVEIEVNVSNNSPLRATICWIDVEGEVFPASLNNRAPVLVNDLDLRIVNAAGTTTYYPYKLDPENPSAAATKNSKNSVDNVEQVYIASPQNGKYKIIIDHAGDLVGGEQTFSLIISGIDDNADIPLCVSGIISPSNNSTTALVNNEIKWRKADFATSYKVYFGTDGNGTALPTNIKNGVQQTENYFYHEMEADVTYYLALQPSNEFGLNNNCNTIFSFTTYSINDFPFEEDLEEVETPSFPEGWQSYDNSEKKWFTTNSLGYESSNSFMCQATDNIKFDNMLISPPIYVSKNEEYDLNFYVKGYLPFVTESLRVVWGKFPTIDRMSNEIYVDEAIKTGSWKEHSTSFSVEENGYIFIGFHLYSESGRQLCIDNISLTSKIGIKDFEANAKVKAYYSEGKLHLASDKLYENVNVTIYNMSGQQVYSNKFNTLQNETIHFEQTSGVYIVNISGKGINESEKIIVK